MKIAIFDDGAGNVHSLAKVLADRGDVVHERDVTAICEADVAVLPGVGAFDTAMASLGSDAARLAAASTLLPNSNAPDLFRRFWAVVDIAEREAGRAEREKSAQDHSATAQKEPALAGL